jgi:hypothetical protein
VWQKKGGGGRGRERQKKDSAWGIESVDPKATVSRATG